MLSTDKGFSFKLEELDLKGQCHLFCEPLNSQKIYLNKWNRQKNGPFLLTITPLVYRNLYYLCLAANGLDEHGLKKFANFFQVLPVYCKKFIKT